ncbi:putative ABC transport system permease protein [Syntrophus gentianae]|uniref:Putative ABC transport system permease protein n=1 Tax=Syntrophus gentianae TaxID=43775 RepID=A0A1H7Y3Y9_9BACT|nr:FtsX-like permease family protein [Syntrophus gentianae]SEM40703.1 putative ABC transport system permease protein [Syntrophus gentianae]
MRTVTKAFLRYLIRRRSLTLLQLMGIAFGVAACLGMGLSAMSALASFTSAIEFLQGKSTHRIERDAGPMDETILKGLMRDPSVQAFSPVIDRRLRLAKGNQIRILGIDPFLDLAIRPELARASFSRDQEKDSKERLSFVLDEKAVLMEAKMAQELGLTAGGKAQSSHGELEIIGTFPNPSGEPLLLMDIAHVQKLFKMPGLIDRVDLVLTEEPGFMKRWERGFRLTSNRQSQETFGAMLGAFRLNLEALSLMALFVSVFLIYNTTMFAVASRRRDAGILRSLGATRGEVTLAFMLEILILDGMGGAIGSLMGYLLSRFLSEVIGGTISNLYFFLRPIPLAWSFWMLAAGVLIGCGASLFGSLFPLIELSRLDPVKALSGRSASRQGGTAAKKIALLGIFVLVLSSAVLFLPSRSIYVAFGAVFGILFGLSLLTGYGVVVFTPLIRGFLTFLGGLPGKIAAGNIRQNLGRTSVAIAAFMVALSMSLGLSLMIGSFRESLLWWMDRQFRGDLYISTASEREVPESFYLELKSIPGVDVDAYRKVQMAYRNRPMFVASINAPVLQRHARFAWLDGGDEHWEAVKRGDVIISESFARNFGVRAGDAISLKGLQGPARLRVEAVFYDYSTEHGLVMMDRGTYLRLFADRTINSVAVFLDPRDPQRRQTMDLIRQKALQQDLPVFTRDQFFGNILAIFDSTFAITRSMRILAIIIAFFGIAGALMTLFLERKSEFGILRALGFSTWQVSLLTLLEAFGMGLMSFLLSVGGGTLFAIILIRVINLRSFNWTIFFHLHLSHYLLVALTALLASLGAALYPIWIVLRTYPQMQIRDD